MIEQPDYALKFKRKLRKAGQNSSMLTLPPQLIEFIGADIEDDLTIINVVGKKGNYLAVFKEDDKKDVEQETPEPTEEKELVE